MMDALKHNFQAKIATEMKVFDEMKHVIEVKDKLDLIIEQIQKL